MSLPSDVVVLFVTRGRAEMPRMVFRRGSPVEPLGVGAEGDWQIDGDGVPDVAFFLAFDGEVIHASSAAPEAAVFVDGRRLDATWVPLTPACEIRFGAAIVRTGARPAVVVGRMRGSLPSLPPPVAPPVAGHGGAYASARGCANDDEPTQVHAAQRPPSPPAPCTASALETLPPMRAPAASEPTLFDNRLRKEALAFASAPEAPPTTAKPRASQAAVQALTPTGPAALRASAAARAATAAANAATAVIAKPRRLSTLGRTAIVLAVVLLGANVARFSRTSPHVAMAPVDVAMAAKPTPSSPAPAAPPALPTPPASATPPALAPPAPRRLMIPPTPTPPIATPPTPTPVTPPSMPGANLAPERTAVNAAASGRFAEAARLYEELSRQNPRMASYAVAAKVLRNRAAQSDDE